jgi:hypothetical protein
MAVIEKRKLRVVRNICLTEAPYDDTYNWCVLAWLEYGVPNSEVTEKE